MGLEYDIPGTKSNQIIFMRHGQSKYRGYGPDLTYEGLVEVGKTVEQLKEHLSNFDKVILITSPANRAQTSAEVFFERRVVEELPRVVKVVGSVKVFDEGKYIENIRRFTSYEQMWLTDPKIASENDMVESRPSVKKRLLSFIYHYANAIDKLSSKSNLKFAVVAVTHMELGTPLLFEANTPAMQNAELIFLTLDDVKKGEFTIFARGKSRSVILTKERRLIRN